ncbi:MAG: hypothetical protein HY657_16755 [Acidobacteria bacterium]|nr:hypothetical protein [Acidobacteriota bacterium]
MDVVLNWLWQGGVVALATAAILRAIPPCRTRARYGLAWAACVGVLVLPTVPLLDAAFASTAGASSTPAGVAVTMPAVWWTSGTAACAAWALWAGVSAGRTVAAMLALRRTKRQAREFPADIEARLAHWCGLRATGRRTRLVLSHGVRTAGVLGGRTPVIAVAPMLLQRLTAADLDRVVIHEWAHVQRRDDIAQVGLRIVRALAGWHPAVWWLQGQLHIEREVACDEMAVAVTGCAQAYATCLTTLAAIPPARAGVPALAAVSASSLRQRVCRIVALRHRTPTRASRVTPMAAVLSVAALTLVVGRLPIVGAIASTAAAPPAPADRVLPGVPQAPAVSRAEAEARPRVTRTTSRARPAASGLPPQPAYEAAERQSVDSAAVPLRATMPLTGELFVLPEPVVSETSSEPPMASAAPSTEAIPLPVWGAAVEAGKAIGAGSEQAAVATAGFFTRFGKRVARSF